MPTRADHSRSLASYQQDMGWGASDRWGRTNDATRSSFPDARAPRFDANSGDALDAFALESTQFASEFFSPMNASAADTNFGSSSMDRKTDALTAAVSQFQGEALLAQVHGVYDRASGKLTLTDRGTGETVTGTYESGGKPYGDPIEPGMYEILDQAQNPNSWRLDPVDSKLRNDTHDATGRTHFRLHRPGRTIGCVAATNSANWDAMKSLLNRTSTTTVPDNATASWKSWFSGPEQVKKFGTLEVK